MSHFLTLAVIVTGAPDRCLFYHREILQFRNVLLGGSLRGSFRHATLYASILLTIVLSTFISAHADPRRYTITIPFLETVFLSTLLPQPPSSTIHLFQPAMDTDTRISILIIPNLQVSTVRLLCSVTFRFDFVLLHLVHSTVGCPCLPNITRKLLFFLLANLYRLHFPFV